MNYSLGNVDIHANDDLAFRSSCGGSDYHGELCNGDTILVQNYKIINYELIKPNIDEKINNKNNTAIIDYFNLHPYEKQSEKSLYR